METPNEKVKAAIYQICQSSGLGKAQSNEIISKLQQVIDQEKETLEGPPLARRSIYGVKLFSAVEKLILEIKGSISDELITNVAALLNLEWVKGFHRGNIVLKSPQKIEFKSHSICPQR